jgi:excisionase family DNA binding protein
MDGPLAFNVAEACSAARIGRTSLYEAIRSGELRALKRGRRIIVLADDLRRYLEGLPAVAPNERLEQIRSACEGARPRITPILNTKKMPRRSGAN